MAPRRSLAPRLTDIVEAAERIRGLTDKSSLAEFESDWQMKWVVERGLEIISEASRYLPPELKTRHSQIPWRNVADIGNVLRHNYQGISAPVIWKLIKSDLMVLESACREELVEALRAEGLD
jgi:uncharacterized protein with HEPN domain